MTKCPLFIDIIQFKSFPMYIYLWGGRKDYDGVFFLFSRYYYFFLYSLNAWNLTCGDDSLVWLGGGGTVLIAFSWDRLLHFLLRSTATTTQCFSLAVIPIFYFSHDFLFFYHNAFTKPFILRCYFSSLARRLWCTNIIQILKYQLKILQ